MGEDEGTAMTNLHSTFDFVALTRTRGGAMRLDLLEPPGSALRSKSLADNVGSRQGELLKIGEVTAGASGTHDETSSVSRLCRQPRGERHSGKFEASKIE